MEATILDLLRFKVGKNTSFISFVGEMEMELTADLSITLTGGEGARQSFVFVGNVTFSCSLARKNISRLLCLWRTDTKALILELIRFKVDKNSSIILFFSWNGDGSHSGCVHHFDGRRWCSSIFCFCGQYDIFLSHCP